MREVVVVVVLTCSCACAGPAAVQGGASPSRPEAEGPPSEPPSASLDAFSPEARALVDAINDYRGGVGLAPIAISPSMMAVADAHVRDLAGNGPVTERCNFHSWSDRGEWSPCCYTSDHAQAQCMWSKPRELTRYRGDGFEIAAGGVRSIAQTIETWDGSPAHREVMVNGGIWTDRWQALGAAIHQGYAVAWFGKEPDP